MSDFPEHFEVVLRLLFKPMALEFLSFLCEPLAAFVQFLLDGFKRRFKAFRTGHKELLGMNPGFFERIQRLPSDRVTDLNALDTIKIKHDANRVVSAWHPDIHHFPAHPAFASPEVAGRTPILEFNQFAQEVAGLDRLTYMAAKMVFEKGLGWIESVDARYRGHDHTIWTRHERCNSGKALLFNTLVDAEFFVNVQVSLGEVGLGLIIVVMRDEIFHGVVWKIPHHLLMQLPSKGLVMTHDEGGYVQVLNDVRHGESLATSRYAEQHAALLPIIQLRNQFFNCFWLVATRFKLGMETKTFDIGV